LDFLLNGRDAPLPGMSGASPNDRGFFLRVAEEVDDGNLLFF
jgi:hypothetical protein